MIADPGLQFAPIQDEEALSRRDSGAAATELLSLLERRGFPARIVSISRIGDLRRELAGRIDRQELDGEFYREAVPDFAFDPPADFKDARSILIAAVPRPQTAASFHTGSMARTLPIPPTYTSYRGVTERWLSWLSAILAPAGYRAAGTSLPLKLLATRSGLASYGRNNITYAAGLGSYFELVSACTDIPTAGDAWGESAMLDRCLNCRACVNRCPTDAIQLDRFLLRAERCLVFHNERPGQIPFPEWIDPLAHHTVIGCLKCQWICPENRTVKGWIGDTEEFTEDETKALLAGAGPGELGDDTVSKLARLDMLRYLDLLPRNLRAALDGGRPV